MKKKDERRPELRRAERAENIIRVIALIYSAVVVAIPALVLSIFPYKEKSKLIVDFLIYILIALAIGFIIKILIKRFDNNFCEQIKEEIRIQKKKKRKNALKI